jgi:hypothetical protein
MIPSDLAIPKAAFATSLELMRRAHLADDTALAKAPAVLDDSFRSAALKAAQRDRKT